MDNEGAYAQDVSSLAAAPAKTGPTAAAVVLEIPEFKTTPYKAEPLANRQTTSESGRGVHPPVATRTSRHPWIVTTRSEWLLLADLNAPLLARRVLLLLVVPFKMPFGSEADVH